MEKACTKCETSKALEDFHRSSRNKDGRVEKCKDCVKRHNAARYENDRDRLLKMAGDWRKSNKDRVAERGADYRAKNKDKIAKSGADYYRRNKAAHHFYTRKRKEKLDAIDELLPGEWEAAVAACNNTCIVPGCGKSPVTRDHVIPVSKGGRHHISNLQPLCLSCNDRKGIRTTDYRGLRAGLTQGNGCGLNDVGNTAPYGES